MTVLLSSGKLSAEAWKAALAANLGGRPLVVAGEDDYDPAAVRYAVVWHPPQGFLAGLPNLRAVFSLGAGVEHILADPALPDVPIARVVDEDLTQRMVEWVAWQVLVHHRQGRAYADQQATATWRPRPQPIAPETRVGILGLGVIGRAAAAVLKRIGFDVAGWSRTARADDDLPDDLKGMPTFAGEAGLTPFLARTDILVCLLPLTPETRGILNADLFARLAQDGPLGGPVVLNAGRGGSQVEADIVAALDAGVLKAAALDVFETEPLPETSPLWGHPRVTVTPHVGGGTQPDPVSKLIVGQIARDEAGLPMEYLVDRTRGY